MRLRSRIIQSLLVFINDKRMFVPVFSLFILIAVGFWFGLKVAVQKNIDYRLAKEKQRIESALSDQLNNDANVLMFVKAFFLAQGVPSQQQFSPLAKNILSEKMGDGLQAIGYMPIIGQKELAQFVRKNHSFFASHPLHPTGLREMYAPLMLAEPLTPERVQLLGFDLYSDSKRSFDIRRAVDSGKITMSRPLRSLENSDGEESSSFILVAPYYGQEHAPSTIEERRAQIQGVIYIPMTIAHFFSTVFGATQPDNEVVNFKIQVQDNDGKYLTIYQRFSDPFEDRTKGQVGLAAAAESNLDFYDRHWKIELNPRPSFYTATDLYLTDIVAVVMALFGLVLIFVFNLTKYQLANERKAKEIIADAAKVSQEKTERLKKLNQMNKSAPVQLGLDKLVSRFFHSTIQMSQATHAFLYFESEQDGGQWDLHDLQGLRPEELLLSPIPQISNSGASKWNFLKQKYITKIDGFETSAELSRLIERPERFIDWILIAVPSLDGPIEKKCGLLFLGKVKGEMFSENDLEMVESIVYQAAIGIDNTKLFKRVDDSNKVKTAFLANMSHEIRTPLNAIIGFSEILAEAKVAEQKRALINVIQKNCLQLTSIIDDILDLSKIEAGKMCVTIRPVALKALVRDIQLIMETRARAKGIIFEVDYEGPVPDFIDSDEVRLKQILVNVVGNAVKFTEKGAVKLHIRCQSDKAGHQQLAFEIIDTGIGITTEAKTHLFQTFSQGDASTTRRFGGTGLGLALSERLAQELGGAVSLEASEQGKGSTFKVTIALVESQKQNRKLEGKSDNVVASEVLQKNMSQPHQELEGSNVLLVEDSEDNQGIFSYFLKSLGASVDIADNGEDAVQNAATLKHDFILMDIQIPKIDGLEATRRIRELGYMHPIIALTAHAFPEEKMNCLKAGCNGLIAKPVTRDNFTEQLIKFMEEFKNDNEYRHSV